MTTTPALTTTDVIYLLKEQCEAYLNVLQTVGGTPRQIEKAQRAVDLAMQELRR